MQPVEKVVGLPRQRTDLARRDIEQVLQARRRVCQTQAKLRPRIDDQYCRVHFLLNQVIGSKETACSSSHDCDRLLFCVCLSHSYLLKDDLRPGGDEKEFANSYTV